MKDTNALKEFAQAARSLLTYVNASEIKVGFAKPYLTEEADVEQYVDAMKRTLLEHIRAGKKVMI